MGEGGDTTFENPAYEPNDPYDDDRFDETTPFIAVTSTPFGRENIEMKAFPEETSGLPEKFMLRPLLEVDQKQVKRPGSQQKIYFQI